ncbi:MAG: DUF1549 and DUF1553 domain-containing protein [Tepidisphaerales bacterium]
MAKQVARLVSVGLLMGICTAAAAEPAGDAKPVTPPLPAVNALQLLPAEITLDGARDARKVLVIGKTSQGGVVDLTAVARFAPEGDGVALDTAGYLHGKKPGATGVIITAGGLQTRLAVNVKSIDRPKAGFVRDVEPILARVGCNTGLCHGSAKGKEGFKLSLRGYDPDTDYQALVDDLSGRRFNRQEPEKSLMLLKPAGGVQHEGGKVLDEDSEQYQVVRQWIAEGTQPQEITARASNIEVLPEVFNLDLPGRSQQMVVLAHYRDGSVRDVTREAVITASNTEALTVKDNTITALRRGEGAVLVRYEGNYATRQAFVMGDRAGYQWVAEPENNYIDGLVHAKLQKMRILPSPLCTDAEFIRRISLDLTGQPATAERVKAFLANPTESRTKREKLVDELLASEDFTDYWSNKWADLLQCNSKALGVKAMWTFRNWIRDRIASNEPYDKFVEKILLAKGSSYTAPEVNYYRALKENGKITEDVSQTFLGVRFNCNKCHDHPFEKWTQNQYYQFGAYFATIAVKPGPRPEEQILYSNYNGGEVVHPKTDRPVAPLVPFGTSESTPAGLDRRQALVKWMTSPGNAYFARAMANRTWSYFFGIGIIDPVDDIRASNPPSNPELLEAITRDFVSSGYDIRKLMRTIALSRAYQRSVATNRWNQDDRVNFSHNRPRRLTAEQLSDAVAVATGFRAQFSGMPADSRAVDLPDGTGEASDMLGLFGKPKRETACECERSNNFTLSHAISMVNGSLIGDAVSNPNNRIARIVAAEKDDRKVVVELYYAIFNRAPTDKELEGATLGEKRLEAAQDLAWAMLNSAAFLYNR